MSRAEAVLAAARQLTAEPLPPARGLAEGSPELGGALLAALFRARHGLGPGAGADAQLSQFAQWLEEYDVQVSEWTVGSWAECRFGCGKRTAVRVTSLLLYEMSEGPSPPPCTSRPEKLGGLPFPGVHRLRA